MGQDNTKIGQHYFSYLSKIYELLINFFDIKDFLVENTSNQSS